MKKVLRSIMWQDPSERTDATANLQLVNPDRFLSMDKADREAVAYCIDFLVANGEAPALNLVYDFFEKLPKPEVVTVLEETVAEPFYIAASFKVEMEGEIERQAADNLSLAMKEAMQIATVGVNQKGVVLKGVDAAVANLFATVRETPKDNTHKIPNSLRDATKSLRELYDFRKANPNQAFGIMTGYGLFDSATGGLLKKQLRLHAGFGGHLKSTLMLNEVLNAATFGWNPLVFSSEMPQPEIMMILVAMHSADPKFATTNPPLNSFRLIRGQLNPQEEAFYDMVADDLVNNPDHGAIRIVDSGEFTTFGSVMQRTIREHSILEVDMMWCDYITRLPIDAKYRTITPTEARNETIADAKRFAMQFNNGEGLVVCSPFQVNREGYKKAKEHGGKMDKCQPLGTPVLTPNGWVRLGDIKEGDFVISRKGKATRVLGVYRPGVKETFRVWLKDGSSTVVCGDHLWLTRDVRKSTNPWKVRSTMQLDSNHSLPSLAVVEFAPQSRGLDPYLVGLLIGDGCLVRSTPQLSCSGAMAAEMRQQLLSVVPSWVTLTEYTDSRNGLVSFSLTDGRRLKGQSSVRNGLVVSLEEIGLWGCRAENKRIPRNYLLASPSDRQSLLQGLMDTDGCVRGCCCYVTSSEGLARDVQELVWSLGGSCTKTRISGRAWKVRISLPPEVKVTRLKPAPKRTRFSRSVSKVTLEGREEVGCILVEDDEHLYVTEDYIVTHNTALAQFNAAEKEADVITYIFFDEDEKIANEPKVGLLKSRWGAENHTPVSLFLEPDSRRIFDLSSGMAVTNAPVGGASEGDVEL